jgi:small subunit ribosomal protein S8
MDAEGNPVITDVKRISKLSKRVYMGSQDIHNVRNGLGLTVVSTSSGVMSAKRARAAKVGGEVMFEIW